mgnify:CR=1 FL=1
MKIKWGDFAVAVLILASAALIFLLFAPENASGPLTAVVRVDGEEYRRIVLSDIPEGETLRISLEEQADMVIEVRQDGVRVARSSCPDQVCVHTGWITKAGQSAVCLPYRVSVRLEGSTDDNVDGIAG